MALQHWSAQQTACLAISKAPMTILPCRVKNFVSEQFPLLYHLAVNFGARVKARSLRDLLQREFKIVELRTIQDTHPMPILFAHVTKKNGLNTKEPPLMHRTNYAVPAD